MLDIPSDRMTLHESRALARTTLDDAPGVRPDLHRAPVGRWRRRRRWRRPVPLWDGFGTRWSIAVSAVVDTARNGPLTVRHGDSDGPGWRAERAIMAPEAAAVAAPGDERLPVAAPLARFSCGSPWSEMCFRVTKTLWLGGFPRTPARHSARHNEAARHGPSPEARVRTP